MSEIIKAHIYRISYKYFDIKENKEVSTSLMCPITSKNYLEIEDIRSSYIQKDVFSSMVTGMLTKDYYQKKGYAKEDFIYKDIKVTYDGYEKWWLIWFCHETFSKFDNEQEAFNDFRDFLESKKVEIRYHDFYDYDYTKDGYSDMGARERWRWELCKCDSCLKSGRTIIKH